VKHTHLVVALLALALASGVGACGGSKPGDAAGPVQPTSSASPGPARSPAQDAEIDLHIKEGVHAVMVGLQSWAVGQTKPHYPPRADKATLAKYMSDPWPVNPLTGADMKPGSQPGDYTYEVGPDKKSCTVTGHLSDGTDYTSQVLRTG
jgi:hypothetical protein